MTFPALHTIVFRYFFSDYAHFRWDRRVYAGLISSVLILIAPCQIFVVKLVLLKHYFAFSRKVLC